MGIFNTFKSKPQAGQDEMKAKPVSDKPVKKEEPKEKQTAEKKEEKAVVAAGAKETKLAGKTKLAHLILVKPLVTEKASHLAALNKYVFVVNSKMNKVEIKKAIRTVYKVNPIFVNICNFSGKSIRYGKMTGAKKGWKKAIVTLKPGDKIEVYEGV